MSGVGDRDGIDEWSVSVRVERFRNRTVGGGVGSPALSRFRQDERFSPFFGADAQGDDLGRGGCSQEFRDTVTSADGDLLVLTDVRPDPERRGAGLGPALACQALWTLGAGCGAVTAGTGAPALTALCESIGFRRRPRPPGPPPRDPATEEARDAREEQRRRYDALVDAWRAAHRG
ncbi:hypothetical protein ACF1FC_10420 [Streptomyces sp. NPDC014344]|uniref:hypothetical protein n=1 Tax=Streptomyces sp. NPDC014344 TaxID=3364871 RepID=UPI0036FA2943